MCLFDSPVSGLLMPERCMPAHCVKHNKTFICPLTSFHCRCRRAIIASHFDEAWDNQDCNAMCDHCCKPKERKEMVITSFCRVLYKLISNAAAVDTKLTGKLDDIFICYMCLLQDCA
jgi:hypothetical protein